MMDNDGLSILEVSWNMGAHKSSICRILHKTNHPAGVFLEPPSPVEILPGAGWKLLTAMKTAKAKAVPRAREAVSFCRLMNVGFRHQKLGIWKCYQHFCGYKYKSPIHQHLWILPTFYLQKNWMPIKIGINQENSGELCGWFAVDKVGRIRNQGCSQHPQGRWNRKTKDEERKV